MSSSVAHDTVINGRTEQVRKIVDAFLAGFGKPLDSDKSRQDFVAIYRQDIEWFDHAFHICRKGHEAVLGLNKAFLHCNQPFASHAKAVRITHDGAVVEQVWTGCCKNDIVRPDGHIAVKGSGKDFRAHVCMVLVVDGDGLISRIDEYYNRAWDEGMGEGQYKVIGGEYHRL